MSTRVFTIVRLCRALGIATALACLTWSDLAAQTSTGAVRGYITDASGAPVAEAQIIARLAATNEMRAATSNAAGFYYLPGLRPGSYEITVRRIGLEPRTRSLQLPIGQTIDLNFVTVAAAAQLATVEVTSPRSQETRTSEVGTNISREQINNLPNFERNVLDLAKLVPGVSAQAVNNTDKFFAAGGQPAEAVNVFVDGASYKNDVLRGGVVGQDASKGNPLPQGAIQEFRVLTQNYKAEYQKAASAIIIATTRSGTNEFEAEAFAYGVGKAYVARDEFAVRNDRARPNYKRLQAGGSVGGPIMRDKLFFFGTYELNFRDEPAYITLGGDTSVAPAALVAELRPHTGLQAQQFREHLGLAKLTYNPNERNTLDGSFTFRKDDDFRNFGGQTSFEGAENLAIDTYTGVGNWKNVRGPWLNEAQLNTQFFTWNPTGRNYDMIGKNYFGLLQVGGKDTEQNFRQNRIALRNDVTRGGIQFAGDHVFKAGANIDFMWYRGIKDFNGNPRFNFRRTPENWATPFEAFIGFGDPKIETDNKQVGVFLQDDWSIGKRLLLNLGIRWDGETNGINNDYVTPQPLADSLRRAYGMLALKVDRPRPEGGTESVNVIQQLGGIENFITDGSSTRPMYKKAFQPRLGASYDLSGDGSTVVFGGAGLYFDRNYWNTLFDEQFRRQFTVIRFEFRPDCAPGATNCLAWDPKYYDPATLRAQGEATGRPEVFLVKNDMVPPRTMQLSFGLRHDIGRQRVTLSYNGLRGRNYMNFVRASPWGGGPALPYNTVFAADDRVKTWYDALQLQVQRPLNVASRWGGGLSYTLAKSQEQGESQGIFWGFDDRYPTVGDLPRRRAPNDQRHSIVANGIFRLPADFLFSTIVNLASGIAVNAEDASRGYGPGERRTYVFETPTRPFLGIGHVFGYQNMDVRLEKGFRLARGSSASLLVDVFNVFNSDNFGCFEMQLRPDGPYPEYGQPKCAGLGRRLQVGLRYGYR
ncbi:MAG: TonB-dependent receptor [Gemmatimonadaceae bacterium]|nr:TonB-dependent receptor [Gemmatimonadaceae bacterium]